MRWKASARLWLGTMGAALALTVTAAHASAASTEPIYVKTPTTNPLDDPCGLAVDISGNVYLSDFHHNAVDVFNAGGEAKAPRLTKVDPLRGPCGLAIDPVGNLWVNDFHQEVIKAAVSPFPLTNSSSITLGSTLDESHSTGVAVNPGSGNVYVDDRTAVAVYSSAGALLETIGATNLLDGYGIAYSGGKVYVPDAGSNSVKVFEPAVSTTNPIATIAGPPGGFGSLVDSAIAVDFASGEIYVADRVGSRLTEHPEAVVDVFTAAGLYKGHLKYDVADGAPVGLAVDNSAGSGQGRVYVTSGASEPSSYYAYGPEAATTLPSQPAVFNLAVASAGSGAIVASTGLSCDGGCQAEVAGGTQLTLRAVPDEGSSFEGWSGAGCGESGGECAVTMDRSREIIAEFAPTPAPVTSSTTFSPVTVAPHLWRHHRRMRHPDRHHPRHRLHSHHRRGR